MSALFSPGCLYVTPGIHALVRRGMDLSAFLSRHLQGDWGDIGADARAANHRALHCCGHPGRQIESAYRMTPYTRILIRSETGSTTIMLSDEETDRRIRYRRFTPSFHAHP